MFQVEVKKSMLQNCICIRFPREEIQEDFRFQMVQQNQIPGVLSPRRTYENEHLIYTIDITGKVSILKEYQYGELGYETIRELLYQIFSVLKQSKDYLLEENSFLLDPQYIFVSKGSDQLSMCYCPGYKKEVREQLITTMEFFMNKVDYKEQQAVRLVYKVHQMVREESCSIYQILKVLSEPENTPPLQKEEQEYIEKEERNPFVSYEKKNWEEESIQKQESIQRQGNTQRQEKIPKEEKGKRKEAQYYFVILGSVIGMLAVLAGCYVLGFLSTKYGRRLDVTRFVGLLFILVGCEGYFLWKLSQKKQDPVEETKLETGMEQVDQPADECGVLKREPIALASKDALYLRPQGMSEAVSTLCIPIPGCVGKEESQVDVVLPSNAVSRVHAQISGDSKQCFIEDLGSTNGTYINGIRVERNRRVVIHRGDELRMADLTYQIVG